jgi:DegV family protein with EDD domain
MIKVVVDSTCDLPDEAYRQNDLTVVPINIQFGTETYLDGIDIDRATFLAKIEEQGTLPSTSQPSIGQFEECYTRLAAEGATDILSLHATAKLSGTFHSAQMAAEVVADRVRVHPFDSACGSSGLGFMAVEAARMVRAGQGVAAILERLKAVRPRVLIVFTLKDLRFAQMSGRVGRLQSSLASLLNLKPIIVLENGLLDAAEKVRTQRRAVERMFEIVAERIGVSTPMNLAVVHAEAPELGRELLDRARSQFNCRETFVENLTTSLLVHFGPGTLALIGYPL